MEKLKDIHLPASEPWWALAWGWWLVIALLLFLAFGLYIVWPHIKRWRNKKRANQALKNDVRGELSRMRSDYVAQHDELALLTDISIFLRRVCVTVFEQDKYAGLIQDDWLIFLDGQWGEHKPVPCFTDEAMADLLKYGAYQASMDETMVKNVEALLGLSEKWANMVLKQHV